MKPSLPTLLALALAAQWLAGSRARAQDNPCAQLRFGYFERIEAQGPFGILTPRADPGAVERALKRTVEDAIYFRKLANSPYAGASAADVARHYFINLYGLCKQLSARGIWDITIACDADTDDINGCDGVGMSAESTVTSRVKSQCLIAAGIPAGSWDGAYSRRIGWSALNEWDIHGNRPHDDRPGFDHNNRYDAVADPQFRQARYAGVLRGLINGLAAELEARRGLPARQGWRWARDQY